MNAALVASGVAVTVGPDRHEQLAAPHPAGVDGGTVDLDVVTVERSADGVRDLQRLFATVLHQADAQHRFGEGAAQFLAHCGHVGDGVFHHVRCYRHIVDVLKVKRAHTAVPGDLRVQQGVLDDARERLRIGAEGFSGRQEVNGSDDAWHLQFVRGH